MLGDHNPIPTLAVKDVQTARDFYEGVLGLSPAGEPPEGVVYRAGTWKDMAVALLVPADRFDEEVAALREKDVTFQTFEAEGLTWDDGVASAGELFRSVWFADPDGNILNVETDNAGL